jgi:uncharacterized membrane protein YgcG
MKRTTLAIALTTGALAVPAVALATGDGGTTNQLQAPSTAPVQQQEEQPQQPQEQQRPDHDCPDGQGGGPGSGGTPPGGSGGGSSGDSGSSDTLL